MITRALDAHRLAPETAAKAAAVSLRGVVTQVMPEWSGFAFQDASEAVYVQAKPGTVLPASGQRVEIDGHTDAGNFAAIVRADRIKILGPGSLPKPAQIDWQYLSSGACDNDYVAVTGIVRSVGAVEPPRWRWKATALRLDLGGNIVWAYIRNGNGLTTEALTGATVRVRGICMVLSNSRRQFERNALLATDSASVQVIEPEPINPFSLPVSSMDHLFAFREGAGAKTRRVRVQGTVTWASEMRLFLQNGSNSLAIRTVSPVSVKIGQCLEAVGFPSPAAYSVGLEDAVVRTCAAAQAVAPLTLNPAEVLSRTEKNHPELPDSTLIRLDATILDLSRPAHEEVLTLQRGETVFTARLPRHYREQDLSGIEEGSEVSVTGVCVIEVDDVGVPRSFEVLLRSPADIHVIARPTWLTRSLAVRAAAGLLAAACVALLWVFMLRNRVRSQTLVIRRQHQREAALEQRTREFVEHASDMVYVLAADGTLLHVNYGTERLTGYSREELLERNWLDLLVPEQREQGRKMLPRDTGTERGEFEQAEWRFLRKDGSEITVEVSQRLETGPQGQIRIEAIGRDVTARKQALFEHEERFHTLADNIPQLAWIADASGAVTWCNRRWSEYTGATPDELRRSGWLAFYHPDHQERVTAHIRYTLRSGESWEDTFPLRGQDGQFRWFLGRAIPIRDLRGNIVSWFGTNTDISEQKRVESELQRSNENLSQFAYIASHDLREPLRNICSFAQLLERSFGPGEVSAKREHYLGVIVSGARRMEALISDLLAYSRAAATQAIERRHVALHDVLMDAIENLGESIRESGAAITYDTLPEVYANPVSLAQVFQNLLGNAMKYRRPGVPVRIHIGATRQVDGWLLSVQDNGMGFDPKYAEHVFGIFKRLHSRDVPGTGIGLAICKAVIERHDGRIWAEGKPGFGATFSFTIPDPPISPSETIAPENTLEPITS